MDSNYYFHRHPVCNHIAIDRKCRQDNTNTTTPGMIKIICQHSGLEVETKTRRTRQHPRIAELKIAANKDGNYREVNNALSEARKRGGYTNIDEYMALVSDIMREYHDKAKAKDARRAEAARKAEADRELHKAEREKLNARLKAAGYWWSKYEPRENMGQDDGYARWDLFSPDGRIVTVDQALEEIERGADVVQAEIAAKHEAEAKANDEAEQAESKAIEEFDAKVEQIKRDNERVEPIEFEVTNTIRIEWPAGRKHSYYRHIDKIECGQVNNIDCWRITTGSGYDDDGYESYYCADAVQAHATKADDSPSSAFEKFFGD